MIGYKEPRIQLINAPLNELKSEVRKTKKLEQRFYETVLVVARKNQGSLKIWRLVVFSNCFVLIKFKMNKTVSKFMLTRDKFMPKLHLKQPEFTYSVCGPFTKHCEGIQKCRQTAHLKKRYNNKLDKACFVQDTAYCDNKDFTKRTISKKNMKEGAYEIMLDPKYDGYQRGLASIIYYIFDQKTRLGATATSKARANEKLAQELHQLMIKKFKKRKVYVWCKDDIWASRFS